MTRYFIALGLTIVLEVPIYAMGLGRWAKKTRREASLIAVAINLITHPIAFLAIYPAIDHLAGGVAALTITEVSVAIGEAALLALRATPAAVALTMSGCANIASFALGWAIVR